MSATDRRGDAGDRHPGDPVRILLVIADLGGGGAEREFSVLVSQLSRERFSPELCFWRPVFAYDPPADVPVHFVRKSRPWHAPAAIRGLARLIDERRPELVFSQLHYVNILTGTALALARHRPRWICRQVNDPKREMRGVFAAWARLVIRRADRVLGCSEGVTRATRAHLHLAPERMATLANAVDVAGIRERAAAPPAPERDPAAFTVVHAGRMSSQKNQALLLEAFARFRNEAAELWMLGDGPLRPTLEARARALGIAHQVRWLGFQANPYPFFRAADCFALSSDHEGLPNAIIEAMLCGTPVVSTRCPHGPDELIEDGITGRLVPVGDARAFGEALAALAGDRGAAKRMAGAAARFAERRFDTRRVCEEYADLFESVARGPA